MHEDGTHELDVDIPAFDPAAGVVACLASSVLWCYGRDYWRTHCAAGESPAARMARRAAEGDVLR